MEKNADQPAFPIQPTFDSDGRVANERYAFEGLTKREYFAAMAMQGIKSNPELCRICDEAAKQNGGTQQEYIAKMAVKDADELLNQLNPTT